MSMITIDQVKLAQRENPASETTKGIQRAYEAQISAKRSEAARVSYLAEQQAERAEWIALRAKIYALTLCVPAGFRLAVLSDRKAAYLGMMPQTAGGWVAVHLTLDGAYQYPALLPASCTDGSRITPAELRRQWLAMATENEHLEDILHFLSTLTE